MGGQSHSLLDNVYMIYFMDGAELVSTFIGLGNFHYIASLIAWKYFMGDYILKRLQNNFPALLTRMITMRTLA